MTFFTFQPREYKNNAYCALSAVLSRTVLWAGRERVYSRCEEIYSYPANDGLTDVFIVRAEAYQSDPDDYASKRARYWLHHCRVPTEHGSRIAQILHRLISPNVQVVAPLAPLAQKTDKGMKLQTGISEPISEEVDE